MLRNLPCTRIQVDEAWSFIYAKEKNVPTAKSAPQEAGDVWTWTICADTKLVPSWRVGDRSAATALDLMDDLAGRVEHRLQIATDGHGAYLEAVDAAFGGSVDYAMLVKQYGNHPGADRSAAVRYSPGHCTGVHVIHISGRPDPKYINTSYAERHNLTMRMSMRRFTRLTNAFSRKIENHAAMVALYSEHGTEQVIVRLGNLAGHDSAATVRLTDPNRCQRSIVSTFPLNSLVPAQHRAVARRDTAPGTGAVTGSGTRAFP